VTATVPRPTDSQLAISRPTRLAPPEGGRGADTRERLLDAAEQIFAERGFEGASMRAVTQAAGVSVSAANYHFGSKEALLRETLLRRVRPLNERRLARLDALEAEAGGRPLELETIVEAFLRPVFEEHAASIDATTRFRQVAARIYSDPPDVVAAMKRELFGPIVTRFVVALAAALPEKSREEIELGFQLTVGVMVHVISGHLVTVATAEKDACECWTSRLSNESVLQQMITYVAAGLRAGSASDGGER
jgi:AcrR family transcriptional regulator